MVIQQAIAIQPNLKNSGHEYSHIRKYNLTLYSNVIFMSLLDIVQTAPQQK
jgi:hypothetical protein